VSLYSDKLYIYKNPKQIKVK